MPTRSVRAAMRTRISFIPGYTLAGCVASNPEASRRQFVFERFVGENTRKGLDAFNDYASLDLSFRFVSFRSNRRGRFLNGVRRFMWNGKLIVLLVRSDKQLFICKRFLAMLIIRAAMLAFVY